MKDSRNPPSPRVFPISNPLSEFPMGVQRWLCVYVRFLPRKTVLHRTAHSTAIGNLLQMQPKQHERPLLKCVVRLQDEPKLNLHPGGFPMIPHQPAPSHRCTRTTIAALALGLVTAATLGCNASQDQNLRTNLAALRAAHADPDAIGSLDATAPPTNLDDYRRHPATFRTVAATPRSNPSRRPADTASASSYSPDTRSPHPASR
jgi:hypothetical protein